jgi:hypothetical protein
MIQTGRPENRCHETGLAKGLKRTPISPKGDICFVICSLSAIQSIENKYKTVSFIESNSVQPVLDNILSINNKTKVPFRGFRGRRTL